MAELIKMLIKV